jgi:Enoyl-(Acyl carrier protein) reductase
VVAWALSERRLLIDDPDLTLESCPQSAIWSAAQMALGWSGRPWLPRTSAPAPKPIVSTRKMPKTEPLQQISRARDPGGVTSVKMWPYSYVPAWPNFQLVLGFDASAPIFVWHMGVFPGCLCAQGVWVDQSVDRRLSSSVLSRLPGEWAEPEEVAALFAFLASDEAPSITGAVYTIDNGLTVS